MIPETKVTTINVSETRTRNTYGVDKEALIIFEEDVAAHMRDGIRLMTNVFRPAKPGKYPAILSLAPYGKHSYPPD